MANKQRNDGHISLNAQQVAFMHQVIESEDKHRAKFSKSPPRRKRNPILGEPTPRSTAREEDFALLKQKQMNHTRKQMALTPTIAGRRRQAEREAATNAIKTVATSTIVPGSANVGSASFKASLSSSRSARGSTNGSARMVSTRIESGRESGSARQSARQQSGRQSGRQQSGRPSARPTGRSTTKDEIGGGSGGGSNDSGGGGSGGGESTAQNVAQMRSRKAWLERQLREVEQSLGSIPEN